MEAIIMAIVRAMIGPLADTGLKAYQAHINGEISHEQLQEKLKEISLGAATQWWASANDATVKTFDSFQTTLRTTKMAQIIWAYFMASQITFIIWLEIGIPFIAYMWEIKYPGVGNLDQWAMGAVLACLGLGPLVLKHSQPEVPKV